MKKKIVFMIAIMMAFFLMSCQNQDKEDELPPMITLYGSNYVAQYMPVKKLPDGYSYLGELTEEQANDTGLAGCKMYAYTVLDSIPDFFVYQECGTPIDENTLDLTKLQWAYVQWIREKSPIQSSK